MAADLGENIYANLDSSTYIARTPAQRAILLYWRESCSEGDICSIHDYAAALTEPQEPQGALPEAKPVSVSQAITYGQPSWFAVKRVL